MKGREGKRRWEERGEGQAPKYFGVEPAVVQWLQCCLVAHVEVDKLSSSAAKKTRFNVEHKCHRRHELLVNALQHWRCRRRPLRGGQRITYVRQLGRRLQPVWLHLRTVCVLKVVRNWGSGFGVSCGRGRNGGQADSANGLTSNTQILHDIMMKTASPGLMLQLWRRVD